jgi:cysteine desulfurase
MEHMDCEKTFLRAMRDHLKQGIPAAVPNCFVTGDRNNRLPNTCNIDFEYIEGEAIVLLSNLGIAASACVSGSLEVSHVMRAWVSPSPPTTAPRASPRCATTPWRRWTGSSPRCPTSWRG